MVSERPEDISGATNIDPTKAIQSGEEHEPQPGQSFQSYMQEGQGPGQTPGRPGEVTPFDLASQGQLPGSGPSTDTLLGQMNSASSVLGDLQKQLNTKNLTLKQSQKYLLRNKLSSANQNIRSAASKAGVDVGPPPSATARATPINKFLALLTDGQTQLHNAQGMVQKLNSTGKMLNPGDLLLIQIKLAKAQQELEYSSVLLSKAVDDVKQVFNIQI